MREGKGHGVVINMARFGLQAGPGLGLYSASRAAILSLTETANAEAARDSLPITSYLVDFESGVRDPEAEVVALVTDLCTGAYHGEPGLVRVEPKGLLQRRDGDGVPRQNKSNKST